MSDKKYNNDAKKQERERQQAVAKAQLGMELAKALRMMFKDSAKLPEPNSSESDKANNNPKWVNETIEKIKQKAEGDNKSPEQIKKEINDFNEGRLAGYPDDFDIEQIKADIEDFNKRGVTKGDARESVERALKGNRVLEEINPKLFANTFTETLKHNTNFFELISKKSFSDKALKGEDNINSKNLYNGSPKVLQDALEDEFSFEKLNGFLSQYGFHPSMIESDINEFPQFTSGDSKDGKWNISQEIEKIKNNDQDAYRHAEDVLQEAEKANSMSEAKSNSSDKDMDSDGNKYSDENIHNKKGGEGAPIGVKNGTGENHQVQEAPNLASGQKGRTIIDPFHTITSKLSDALNNARNRRVFGHNLNNVEQMIGSRVGELDDPAYQKNGLFNQQARTIAETATEMLKGAASMKPNEKTRGKLSELNSHIKLLNHTINERLKEDQSKPDSEKMSKDEKDELEKVQKMVKEIMEALKNLLAAARGKTPGASPAP